MNCPTCPDSTLTITERQGIEIDYCPKCRGVWLDRGELDKIIERADSYREPPREAAPATFERERRPMKPDDSHYGYEHNSQHRRKKSFWTELFD